MPQIITFSEMTSSNRKNLHENTQVVKSMTFDSSSKYVVKGNVFLSHSSKDKEYLPYPIRIINNHGGKCYVDIGDSRLPNPPSVETARILKDTIVACKKFVVFVTTNSKDSRWIPWELGLGDGAKDHNEIALFPSADTSDNTFWLNQEYLGLYRRIVWGKLDGYDEEVWMVWDYQTNTATELSKWLNQ